MFTVEKFLENATALTISSGVRWLSGHCLEPKMLHPQRQAGARETVA